MVVNVGMKYRPHDLLRFAVADYESALPSWADRDDGHSWAVVRRQRAADEQMIAVGLRGRDRAERAAIEIRAEDVVRKVSPEELVSVSVRGLPPTGISETLRSLSRESHSWFGTHPWGPTGSVGFQLATGWPVVRESSDLDLILRVDSYLPRIDARAAIDRLATLPSRVDCLVETPAGAVALAEWASPTHIQVLLRTAQGPLLTTNPWGVESREQVSA